MKIDPETDCLLLSQHEATQMREVSRLLGWLAKARPADVATELTTLAASVERAATTYYHGVGSTRPMRPRAKRSRKGN